MQPVDPTTAVMHRLWFDQRTPTAQFDGPTVATVVSATTTSVRFTVDGYNPDMGFTAPLPTWAATWSGGVATPSPPAAGTKILVVFPRTVGSVPLTDTAPWIVGIR